jgi:hypothetical protein
VDFELRETDGPAWGEGDRLGTVTGLGSMCAGLATGATRDTHRPEQRPARQRERLADLVAMPGVGVNKRYRSSPVGNKAVTRQRADAAEQPRSVSRNNKRDRCQRSGERAADHPRRL